MLFLETRMYSCITHTFRGPIRGSMDAVLRCTGSCVHRSFDTFKHTGAFRPRARITAPSTPKLFSDKWRVCSDLKDGNASTKSPRWLADQPTFLKLSFCNECTIVARVCMSLVDVLVSLRGFTAPIARLRLSHVAHRMLFLLLACAIGQSDLHILVSLSCSCFEDICQKFPDVFSAVSSVDHPIGALLACTGRGLHVFFWSCIRARRSSFLRFVG